MTLVVANQLSYYKSIISKHSSGYSSTFAIFNVRKIKQSGKCCLATLSGSDTVITYNSPTGLKLIM
jgi:hypothetical protein